VLSGFFLFLKLLNEAKKKHRKNNEKSMKKLDTRTFIYVIIVVGKPD